MVSDSKVMKSKYRADIITMLRSKWPLERVRDWLLARDEKISIMSLSRFRQKYIPPGDMLSTTYFENRCKELDIKLLALVEHARAIHVQKERCSLIFEQEQAHHVVFPEGRKEMTLLSEMLFRHKRMEDEIALLAENKEDKVIELKWMDDDNKDDKEEFTINENGKEIRNRDYQQQDGNLK